MARNRIKLSRINKIRAVDSTFVGFEGYGVLYTKKNDSTNGLYYYANTSQTYNILDNEKKMGIQDPLSDSTYDYIDIHTFTTGTTTIFNKTFINFKMPYGKSANINLWGVTYKFENTKTKKLKIYDIRDNYLEKTLDPIMDTDSITNFHIPYGISTTVIEMTYHGFGHYQHFSFKRITNPSDYQKTNGIQYQTPVTGLSSTISGVYDDAFWSYAKNYFTTLYSVYPTLQNNVKLSSTMHGITSFAGNKWVFKEGGLFYSFRTNQIQNTITDYNLYPTWLINAQGTGYTTSYYDSCVGTQPTLSFYINRSTIANGVVITTPNNEMGVRFRKFPTLKEVWAIIDNKINGISYACSNTYLKYGVSRSYYYCSLVPTAETQNTYYFDNSIPLNANYVYSNSSGTIGLNSGNYVITNFIPAIPPVHPGTYPSTGFTPTHKFSVGTGGLITRIEICTGITTPFTGFSGYTYFATNNFGFIGCEFCEWVNISGATHPSNVVIREYGGINVDIDIGDLVEVDTSVKSIEQVLIDGLPYPSLNGVWQIPPDGAYSNGNYTFMVHGGFVTHKQKCTNCTIEHGMYFFDGSTGLTTCCQTCLWTNTNDPIYNSNFILTTNNPLGFTIGTNVFWDSGTDTTENIINMGGNFANRRTGVMTPINYGSRLIATNGINCYHISPNSIITGITTCVTATSGQTSYIPSIYYFDGINGNYNTCCKIYNFFQNTGSTVISDIGLKSIDLCNSGITLGSKVEISDNNASVEAILLTVGPPFIGNPFSPPFANAPEGRYSNGNVCYTVDNTSTVINISYLPPNQTFYYDSGDPTICSAYATSATTSCLPYAVLYKSGGNPTNGYDTTLEIGDFVETDTSIIELTFYISGGKSLDLNCTSQTAPDGFYTDGNYLYEISGGSGEIIYKTACP